MSFFDFLTGLFVMVFFLGSIVISLFVFMMSKILNGQKKEYKIILLRVFIGAMITLLVFAFIAMQLIEVPNEEASATVKENFNTTIGGLRFILLLVPLLFGGIFGIIPSFKNRK